MFDQDRKGWLSSSSLKIKEKQVKQWYRNRVKAEYS